MAAAHDAKNPQRRIGAREKSGSARGFAPITNSEGIFLLGASSVTNLSTGTIGGYGGVSIAGAAGTVTNAGMIDGDSTVPASSESRNQKNP